MADIAWTPGMKVALIEGYSATPQPRMVKRVTPSGMPIIAGASDGSERKFAKDGRERGRYGGHWGKPRLEPWAEKHDQQRATERREYLHREIGAAMRALDSYPVEEITAAVAEIRTARLAAKAKAA